MLYVKLTYLNSKHQHVSFKTSTYLLESNQNHYTKHLHILHMRVSNHVLDVAHQTKEIV